MDYIRNKIRAYWKEGGDQKKESAVSALPLYQSRLNLNQTNVLDIGCGNGDYGIELAKAGASVIALDLSRERMDIVKKKAAEQPIQLELVLADAQKAPFKNSAFDLILCRNVIEHVNSPEKLTAEMARILKPGGAIQLTAPNRFSISQLVRDEHYRLPLVIILPQRMAKLIVCKLFNLEDQYSVSSIPSFKLLKQWIKNNGLIFKMDLPNPEMIRDKWMFPEKVNNQFIRLMVTAVKLLGITRVVAEVVSSERFLGAFAARWSLWVMKSPT
jgi:ubiquinone/menaquinone biosynthesis C-methylase UbiE